MAKSLLDKNLTPRHGSGLCWTVDRSGRSGVLEGLSQVTAK
jgi:hypothetical protein